MPLPLHRHLRPTYTKLNDAVAATPEATPDVTPEPKLDAVAATPAATPDVTPEPKLDAVRYTGTCARRDTKA